MGFIELTIGEVLDEKARQFPDKDALVHPFEGVRYTTAQFKQECDRVAGAYGDGHKKG